MHSRQTVVALDGNIVADTTWYVSGEDNEGSKGREGKVREGGRVREGKKVEREAKRERERELIYNTNTLTYIETKIVSFDVIDSNQ